MWPPFFERDYHMKPDQILSEIQQLLSFGSEFLLQNRGTAVIAQQKGDRDYALTVDVELERQYSEQLHKLHPEIPILGEELSPDLACNGGLFWAIDPIDGTVNYANGLPEYGTSIALIENEKPIAAGIAFPSLGEVYLAAAGKGAFLNGKPIHVSEKSALNQMFLGFGDFAVTGNYEEKNVVRMGCLQSFAGTVMRVRMPGSAALQLAWLAVGRLDISITLSNNPWDVQAGVLLVREAGGQVYDHDGTDHTIHSRYTLASNSTIKQEILKHF